MASSQKTKGGTQMESRNLPAELSQTMSLADVFYQSGMFKDVATQAQAVVKIMAGRELGLAPIEAMTNLYMVNGKVALQAKAIAGLIRKSKKYDYRVDKLTDDECTLTFVKIETDSKEVEIGKSTFTIKDAAKAGIVNKDVWKNYPRNLLFARALSNGSKWYCPNVFSGYTVEEIESVSVQTESVVSIQNGEVVSDGGQETK